MNVKLLVDGGAMKPGPALSQKLGPAGIPINEVISQVNEATTSFKGMQVPVELEVDLGTKTFEIQVFSPPISGLLKKEAGVEKGSGLQSQVQAANLSIEQIISVAKQKMGNLLCKNLKSAVKITIGSCVSLGFLVENLPAVKVNQLVEEGKYDKEIEGEMIKTPEEKRKELDTYFAEIKVEQEKILKEHAAAEEEKKK